MKNLPILSLGEQNFEELRNKACVYVDKTAYIYDLVYRDKFKYNFLARPRRFGKSLLVSTFQCIFEGKKHLFEGLYIYDKIEWEVHPIISIDFTQIGFNDLGLRPAISRQLIQIASRENIVLHEENIGRMLAELMQKLYKKTGKKVVILIDEYDKPITDVLEVGQNEKAHQNREILRDLYSVLKGSSPYIHFFFMTGISRFSKLSLFSGLNNLIDLSYITKFDSLIGYTHEELKENFDSHLKHIAEERQISIDKLLEKIKYWYNGFSWNGREKYYNPHSILYFLASKQFKNYWFESGTASFLIKYIKQDFVYDMSNKVVSLEETECFDIDNLNLTTLLFQTGYLTIKSVDELGRYLLGYPNKEVEESMLRYILVAFSNKNESLVIATDIVSALTANDMNMLMSKVNALFAAIPYPIFDAHKEKYFHAILFLTLKLCGFHIESEVTVSTGRIDAVLQYQNRIYIFEFKLDKSAKEAITQIKAREYFKRYSTHQEKEVYLVGVNFSSERKEVSEWEVEKIEI